MAAGGRRGLANAAGIGMVTAWRVRVGSRAAVDGAKQRAARVAAAAQALTASDLSGDLNRLVAAAVKGAPTVYDKAMDANYLDPALRSGLGGSYHRLFDGGHTIAGAFRATKGVSPDDAVVKEALGTIKALLRDASTPRGLPLANWDKPTFDSVAAALESKFNIPKAWFYELNTYDAADLLGGAIGVVAVIYRWNDDDTEEFARLASAIGTSAAASVNPLLMVVSVVAMARAYNKASSAEEFAELIDGGFKGAATSGASMAAIAVAGSAGASAGLALVVGVTAGVLAYKVSDKVSLMAIARFVKDQASVLWHGAVSEKSGSAHELGDGGPAGLLGGADGVVGIGGAAGVAAGHGDADGGRFEQFEIVHAVADGGEVDVAPPPAAEGLDAGHLGDPGGRDGEPASSVERVRFVDPGDTQKL